MEKGVYHILCCVIIIVVLEFVNSQKFVGDNCRIGSTGTPGKCEIISKCQSAVQALQSKKSVPQICGFQGTQSIICCADSASNIKSTSPRTVTKFTTKGTTVRTPATRATTTKKQPVGDKSRAKCKEYVKHVYQYVIPGAPPTADCALSEVPLIVGGEKAKSKEFPHMALIGFNGENNKTLWQCGGSLISEEFVLTAGHCLFDKELGDAKYIRIGELVLNSNSDDAEPQDFKIIASFKNPGYRPPSQYNDICLVKMDRKAKLNPYARPACLDTQPVVDSTRKLLATGWGKVGYSSGTSQDLLKVTLEPFTNSECNTAYKSNKGLRLKNGIVEKTQFCAGSHDQSKDTCQGDSGGPLQVVDEKEFCMYRIIGVTSFGKACGIASIPGVYTRVSSYIEWIEGIVWP